MNEFEMMTKSPEELRSLTEHRRELGRAIDPETAEVTWWFGQVTDPYGDCPYGYDSELNCIGRLYFARASGAPDWIWWGDLPQATLLRLRERVQVNPSLVEIDESALFND